MLKLGEILFKLRDYTPIPFVIVMMIYAATNSTSLAIGSILMLFGEFVRIKGVSHIGGISRTRSHSTGKKLITSGLFAHVRNPLYIGNFFLSVGLVVMANVHLYFTALFIIMFFLQYIPIIKWEEHNLKKVFGKEFEDYLQKVPRIIPSVTAKIQHNDTVTSDYKRAIKSEKNTLLAVILLYLILLWRSDWFRPIIDAFSNF